MEMCERHCVVTKMKPEKREEYEKLHNEIWEDVVGNAHKYGLRNYSIFIFDNYYISYFEYVGTDYERDMAEKNSLPVMKKWKTLCEECYETCPVPELMFHHDF